MQEHYLELLKIYYDEWKYRHEHLWKTLIHFFVVIFFTSTFPITVKIFDGAAIPNIPLALFPVTGCLLTMFYLWYGLLESIRLKAINVTIETMIQDMFPKYKRAELVSFVDGSKKAPLFLRLRIALWLPILFSAIEIIISVFMLLLIFTNSLNA